MNMAENPNPSQTTMNFAIHFASIYDELTGSISEIEERGMMKLADGREVPNLVQVVRRDPSASPITNDNGARRVIHGMRLLMNPHNFIGKLNNDQIATITGNSIREIGVVMLSNKIEYGITSTSKLEAEMLELFDSTYTWLTGLLDGGNRDFIAQMYQIKVETREDALKAQAGLASQ